MTRTTRTIDGFNLFPAIAGAVPVFVMAGVATRGIIGAGAECTTKQRHEEFSSPDPTGLATPPRSAD